MANEWRLVVAPGGVRLERRWVADPERPELRPFGWHQRWASDVGRGLPKSLRGDDGQSSRSRSRMRWQFVSLPWELLGPRLVMLSLTIQESGGGGLRMVGSSTHIVVRSWSGGVASGVRRWVFG